MLVINHHKMPEIKTDLAADGLGVRLGLLGGHCDGSGVSEKEKSGRGLLVLMSASLTEVRSIEKAELRVRNIPADWNSHRRAGRILIGWAVGAGALLETLTAPLSPG